MPRYPPELRAILDDLPLNEEYRVPDHENVPYFAEGLQVRGVHGDFLLTESPIIDGEDDDSAFDHDLTCRKHEFTSVDAGIRGTFCCFECNAVKFPAAALDGVAV